MAGLVNLDNQTFWTPRQRPQRVDNRTASHSSTLERQSERQSAPPSSDHGPLSVASPRQEPASGKDCVIYISDDMPDMSGEPGDEPAGETLSSVQVIVQSLEESEMKGSIGDVCNQTSTVRSVSFTPLDQTQIDQNPGPSFDDSVADYPTDVSSWTPRIRAPTPTSMPAASRTNTPSPESQPWDIVSTPTSCTSMSAAEVIDEADIQKTAETCSPDEPGNDSTAPESTSDNNTSAQPLLRRHTHQRLRSKRRKESSLDHDAEQPHSEDSPGVLGDAEYCPSTDHETEEGSDGQSSAEDRPSRKRRKLHSIRRKTRSPSERSASCTSMAGGRVATSASPVVPKRAGNATDSTDAAFDEWPLHGVVLQRTIMNGKATFRFQFDWDLCMKHAPEAAEIRKTSKQQARGRSTARSNGRRRFTAEEERWLVAWKEERGLCWDEIWRRFCDKFEERSKGSLQVQYCTKLKTRNDS